MATPHNPSPPPSIALIVGLGNPGSRYLHTRHNAGFDWVAKLQVSLSHQKRFNAQLGETEIGGHRVRVMQPETFMNCSGSAVAAVVDFYRIPVTQVLVVHDELYLAPGDARLKVGGGHGGHNGVRDLITHLSSADFVRLRLGIGHPGTSHEVARYVLRKPPLQERELLHAASERALAVLAQVVTGSLADAMQTLHGHSSRPPVQPDGATRTEA